MSEQELLDDIEFLLGSWFSALEDEECISFANKYEYTDDDYKRFLGTIY